MIFSKNLYLKIKQLELPFIEFWIEQMEFQIEVDAEVSDCLADLMHKTHA